MQIKDLPSTSTVQSTDFLVKEQANGTTEKIAIGDFVVNNLTSTATDKPLSANMGKKLNDKFGIIKSIDLIKDVSDGSGFKQVMFNKTYTSVPYAVAIVTDTAETSTTVSAKIASISTSGCKVATTGVSNNYLGSVGFIVIIFEK